MEDIVANTVFAGDQSGRFSYVEFLFNFFKFHSGECRIGFDAFKVLALLILFFRYRFIFDVVADVIEVHTKKTII